MLCARAADVSTAVPTAAGFTLIEVLVAVFVLALGIMGGTAMQLSAQRTRAQSAALSEAAQLAAGLAERMRANPGAGPYLQFDYDAQAEPAAPPVLCYGADARCGPAELAAFDLYELQVQLHAHLPGGRARICRDGAAWQGGQLRWDCSGGGAPVVVKIGWRSRNPDGSLLRDDAGQGMPGVAVTVGAAR